MSSDSAATDDRRPSSPFTLSPWKDNHEHDHSLTSSASRESGGVDEDDFACMVGSLVREEGHIYSLAALGDLLYTGSESKNIRVWRHHQQFSGFKAASGLVKSIVVTTDRRIFTGHQDGKIRIWRASSKDPRAHKHVGTLPRLKDLVRYSIRPSSYVSSARHTRKNSSVWIKHSDVVSCLCLSEDQSLLYSGSWDRTLKVWCLADLRCLESVNAHSDAVNAVVAAPLLAGLVVTGSADGTVKVWRRESSDDSVKGRRKSSSMRHVAARTLLKQEMAVTALTINKEAGVLYGGSSDGAVWWWDRAAINGSAGSGYGVLRWHEVSVLCLAAVNELVFSGSADNNICVWRRSGSGAHECLAVLTGHEGPVKCLAATEERAGRWVLYSGSLDKSVKVWRVADGEGEREKTEGSIDTEDHEVGNFDDTF